VTDRHTHDYGIYRASMASRVKNAAAYYIGLVKEKRHMRRPPIKVHIVTVSTHPQQAHSSDLSVTLLTGIFSLVAAVSIWSSGAVFSFDASLRHPAPRSRALPNHVGRHSSAFLVRCSVGMVILAAAACTQHTFFVHHTVSYIKDLSYCMTVQVQVHSTLPGL